MREIWGQTSLLLKDLKDEREVRATGDESVNEAAFREGLSRSLPPLRAHCFFSANRRLGTRQGQNYYEYEGGESKHLLFDAGALPTPVPIVVLCSGSCQITQVDRT